MRYYDWTPDGLFLETLRNPPPPQPSSIIMPTIPDPPRAAQAAPVGVGDHPFTITQLKCCAFHELNNISYMKGPEDIMENLRDYFLTLEGKAGSAGYGCEGTRKPFILFTEATSKYNQTPAYGQALASFIKDQDLGDLVEIPSRINWTGNAVRAWIWAINPGNIRNYYSKLERK